MRQKLWPNGGSNINCCDYEMESCYFYVERRREEQINEQNGWRIVLETRQVTSWEKDRQEDSQLLLLPSWARETKRQRETLTSSWQEMMKKKASSRFNSAASKKKQTKTVLKVLSKGNKLILLDFLITLQMPCYKSLAAASIGSFLLPCHCYKRGTSMNW